MDIVELCFKTKKYIVLPALPKMRGGCTAEVLVSPRRQSILLKNVGGGYPNTDIYTYARGASMYLPFLCFWGLARATPATAFGKH